MTIDETISHALEVAEQEECFINYPHSDIVLGDLDIESRKHYAAEQRQLAEWLKELKEAKRLLKLALNDFETIESNLEYDEHCVIKTHSIRCDECPLSAETIYRCKWRYADEVLALIGEDGDTNG